ncbi:hypothetical protein [Rhodocyclus tenuis]|uniref:Glycosyl transferase family 28 C-terminal domain-containing protein n=1 Tax=Rhodocyclus tenuis TaxID=1066 RepID=A0A840G8H0_RHOTE|nr:hypothetical protein [Rhodocyclus tenuis]MBB4248633.1 hypothetical protein [Rhodocyclus tenuis]
MHLFVDISAHGLGHLAISAPVIAALAALQPQLRLSIRSGLPKVALQKRIPLPFTHIAAASDFGFVMRDATRIDLAASAVAYRAAHADWPARVAAESAMLAELAPDLVFSNVSYLPLAGAAVAGIPAAALCSLNWAGLFAHFFAGEPWAPAIHREMLAAYRSAPFLRTSPAMPMNDLGQCEDVGLIARLGSRQNLGLPPGLRTVLVAMGGIRHRLPLENWPRQPGLRWLVPGEWQCTHPDAIAQDCFALAFTDLLASADAVITKPGYGTFTEAACNAVPVLYQRREDWPEQDCLIDWLQGNARCLEVSADRLQSGDIAGQLDALWAMPQVKAPQASGAEVAARRLLAQLHAPAGR